jgi:hypothetical protein
LQDVIDDLDDAIGAGGWDTTPRSSAPGSPVVGMVYTADSDNWNPCSSDDSTDYLVIYNGTTYLPLKKVDGTPIVQTAAPTSPVEGWTYHADADGTWDPDTEVSGTDRYAVEYNGTSYVSIRKKDGTLLISALEIPNGTDPDLTTESTISNDTDGANESGDVVLRGHDGTNQFAYNRKLKPIHFTVVAPNDLADAARDHAWFWENESGMTYTVVRIHCVSDTDDTALTIMEEDADGANDATVDAITISTDGTGLYYQTETTITGPTIESGHLLYADFDDTDTPGQVKCTIRGWFNADVD